MLGIMVLIVVVGGGAALSARAAREQGRSEPLWTAIALLSGLASFLTHLGVVEAVVSLDGPAWAAVASGPLLLILGQGAVLLTLHWLSRAVPTLQGSRFVAYRIGDATGPGYDCDIELQADGVTVQAHETAAADPLLVEWADIETASVDGECVKIVARGADPSLLLQVGGEHLSPLARNRQATALAGRIRQML